MCETATLRQTQATHTHARVHTPRLPCGRFTEVERRQLKPTHTHTHSHTQVLQPALLLLCVRVRGGQKRRYRLAAVAVPTIPTPTPGPGHGRPRRCAPSVLSFSAYA